MALHASLYVEPETITQQIELGHRPRRRSEIVGMRESGRGGSPQWVLGGIFSK